MEPGFYYDNYFGKCFNCYIACLSAWQMDEPLDGPADPALSERFAGEALCRGSEYVPSDQRMAS